MDTFTISEDRHLKVSVAGFRVIRMNFETLRIEEYYLGTWRDLLEHTFASAAAMKRAYKGLLTDKTVTAGSCARDRLLLLRNGFKLIRADYDRIKTFTESGSWVTAETGFENRTAAYLRAAELLESPDFIYE